MYSMAVIILLVYVHYMWWMELRQHCVYATHLVGGS